MGLGCLVFAVIDLMDPEHRANYQPPAFAGRQTSRLVAEAEFEVVLVHVG